MRSRIFFASVVGLSLAASTAMAGQSHYLTASAFNQFTSAKSVQPPDLNPSVDTTHGLGVGGVDPTFIQNHSSVNTDSGHLLVASIAAQPVLGMAVIDPSGWQLGAHFEESAKPGKPKATGVTATMKIDAAGKVGSANDSLISLKLSAELVVDGCRIGASRTITTTTAGDLVAVANCTARGAKARLEGSLLIIDADELLSTTSIEATVTAAFTYAGQYAGSHDFTVTGDVHVQARGGVLEFTSPSFGSTAAPAPGTDGGAPPAGSDAGSSGGPTGDAGSGSSGGVDPGNGGGGDSGCNVGGASSATSTAAGMGLAFAAAALLRRARRRRAQ